jgi:Zn-dependent oligopeptidase
MKKNNSGELIAYRMPEEEKIKFEVFVAKIESRIERIESHASDLKQDSIDKDNKLKVISEKVSNLCFEFHEAINTMHTIMKRNEAVCNVSENDSKRIDKLETSAGILKWAVPTLLAVWTILMTWISIHRN